MTRTFARPLLLPVLLGVLAFACGSKPSSLEGDGQVDGTNAGPAPWAAYEAPPAPGDWETSPLDEARYVSCVADVACVNRDHPGPDGEKSAALERVYFHHRTSAPLVAAYGAAINRGPKEDAHRVAKSVAQAMERCGTR